MKHFIIAFILSAGILTSASAQSFTQRIQQKAAGKGTVTIHESAEIDQLVNNTRLTTEKPAPSTAPAPVPNTPARPTATTPASAAKTNAGDLTAMPEESELPVDNTKKIMVGGRKVNGYRVQAFAGGNSRKDRIEAERTGDKIKASFPEEPVYVHFYSPRWICRIGNYRTYEEAHQMLLSLRKMGYSQAIIVKGKITVPN